MFYMGLCSGSRKFIDWLRKEINKRIGIKGHITSNKKKEKYFSLRLDRVRRVHIIHGTSKEWGSRVFPELLL